MHYVSLRMWFRISEKYISDWEIKYALHVLPFILPSPLRKRGEIFNRRSGIPLHPIAFGELKDYDCIKKLIIYCDASAFTYLSCLVHVWLTRRYIVSFTSNLNIWNAPWRPIQFSNFWYLHLAIMRWEGRDVNCSHCSTFQVSWSIYV